MFAIGTCVSSSLKQNFHKENPCTITYVALAALALSAIGAAMISQGGDPITGGVLLGLGALEALVDLVFYTTAKKPTPTLQPPPNPPKKPTTPPPQRVLVQPTGGGMDMSIMVLGGTGSESSRGGSKLTRAFGSVKDRLNR